MAGEFPNRQAIAAHQLGQLRQLLGAILPRNAFYQAKYAKLDSAVASLEDFSRRFPLTTKAELAGDQRARPPYGGNLTYPLEKYTRFHQTSGTSSAPLRWLDTPESWSWMLENWKEVYRAAGVGAADRIYFAFSFGPFIGFWLAFEAAQQLQCLCLPGGGSGSAGRLRVLCENKATVLCCTPSYAARLAEVAAAEKINLHDSAIRRIILAGEAGGSIPATRQRLEQLWPGARTFDHHGMTETGPVSHECPAQPGLLHILEAAFLAEVIEANGAPAVAGQTGELVLTALGRWGSPVLRYRTGDMVRPIHFDRQPCACGRHDLGLQGGILGRTDEMVIVRGVNIYPTAVEEIVRGFSDIAEYEVRVDKSASLAELILRIEPRSECGDPGALLQSVQSAVQAVFNLRVPVELASAGSLPRFEMKAKRWKFGFESGAAVS
jgi:phenylacetate-CoA ligase